MQVEIKLSKWTTN